MMDGDFSSVCKERTWENGENITDGYVFRGKRPFDKVLEGLKEHMVKGYRRHVNKIELKVLDSRKKGVELEIEVEIVDGNKKGIAILKLYGPNKKKENVVSVTRCKGNDVEFVEILAQKILKPLMGEYLKEKSIRKSHSVTVKGKRVNLYKCRHCEKTSHSLPGLKGHVTKKHTQVSKNKRSKNPVDIEILESPDQKHNLHILKEAEKVVSHLINDMIDVVDETDVTLNGDDGDSDTDSCVTIEEGCDESNRKPKKEYSNTCDECDFKITTERKYVAVQQLLTHKNMVHPKSCNFCEYKAKNLQEMKRHARDVHAIISGSTSPPTKKKKPEENIDDNLTDEVQLTDEMMEVDNISNLSEQLEVMDIEEEEDEDNDDTMEARSAKMDKKVEERQERIEEEERKRKETKSKVEAVRASEKQVKLEKQRKERIITKQKSKNMRKTSNKMKKGKFPKDDEVLSEAPNLKKIPSGCEHLVNPGDVVYVVPGDGACCPNCAAAFFFHDEIFGPKLRRKMNEFFVKHYERKYKEICPCSKESPFVRMTASGEVKYEDPGELFKFLLSCDKKSDYMWSDSVDLLVIADMYQVNIKVITIKRLNDKNPSVNWFYPDKNMAKFAELKNVEQNDMVLLHEDDSHYNLIISQNSDLAKFGSLSHRFNAGPSMKKIAEETKVESDKEGEGNKTMMDLKRELKKSKDEKAILQKEYNDCEKELRLKTEEAESLKTEVKDLKEMLRLEKLLKESDDDSDIDHGVKKCNDEEELPHKMKNMGSQRKNPQFEPEKKSIPKGSSSEPQYNCDECDYQGISKEELKKHVSLKHRLAQMQSDEGIKCRNCGETFNTKWDMMAHRKTMHLSTVAYCKRNIDGTCPYTQERCWWNHAEKVILAGDQVTCFICNKTFRNKHIMMKHRKNEHAELIRPCTQYQSNSCRFLSEVCWFKHVIEKGNEPVEDEEERMQTESVFSKASGKMKPPLATNQKQKETQEETSEF